MNIPMANCIDLILPCNGSSIPRDHGYSLYAAISRIVPTVHQSKGIGIFAIRGSSAGDGTKIPAFLTLPNGRAPKNLPLVVLPHGGPEGHDEPGFDWLSQALASQGYAVLQPEFRGSDGLGWEFLDAGYGQWGRKMQSDLSDGVRALRLDRRPLQPVHRGRGDRTRPQERRAARATRAGSRAAPCRR